MIQCCNGKDTFYAPPMDRAICSLFRYGKRVRMPLKMRVILVSLTIIVGLPLSQAYYWIKKGNLPDSYSIPSHGFRVVDASSGKPVGGVIAVYHVVMDPIYRLERPKPLDYLFLVMRDPVLLFYDSSEYVWPYQIACYESVDFSDEGGWVAMPALVDLKRDRNYGLSKQSPVLYLFKEGYWPLKKVSSVHDTLWCEKVITPPWTNQEVALSPFQPDPNHSIPYYCRDAYQHTKVNNYQLLLVNLYNYFYDIYMAKIYLGFDYRYDKTRRIKVYLPKTTKVMVKLFQTCQGYDFCNYRVNPIIRYLQTKSNAYTN